MELSNGLLHGSPTSLPQAQLQPATSTRTPCHTKIQIDQVKRLSDDVPQQQQQQPPRLKEPSESEDEEATACIRDKRTDYGDDGRDEHGQHEEDPLDGVCFDKNDDKVTISTAGSQHKPSIQDDMLQSVNNLRLNVNKNRIIGKMRKLSITELNRRSRSSKHARFCKFAFYIAITLLSFLFLYLIYQNLFND